MTEKESYDLDQFCRVMAAALVFSEAFDMQIRKVEKLGDPLKLRLIHELKNAVSGVLKSAKSMRHYFETITEFSVRVAVTEKGAVGSIDSYDTLQNDACIINEIFYWLINARNADDNAHIKVVSYLKSMVKDEPLIDTKIIESMKVRL